MLVFDEFGAGDGHAEITQGLRIDEENQFPQLRQAKVCSPWVLPEENDEL